MAVGTVLFAEIVGSTERATELGDAGTRIASWTSTTAPPLVVAVVIGSPISTLAGPSQALAIQTVTFLETGSGMSSRNAASTS